MNITRAYAEQELISRAKNKMLLVEMEVSASGSNSSLDSPMSTALRKMGIVVSGVVSDEDLALLDGEQVEEFLDRAELRLLENIQGNFDLANTRIGNRWEDFKDLIPQLESRINSLKQVIGTNYGEGGASMSGGYIGLDFAEKMDE
jgi:hypothetical protein